MAVLFDEYVARHPGPRVATRAGWLLAALAAMTPVLVLGASHQEEAVLSSVPPAYSLVLTDEERAWIAGHPTVTVGVLPDRRPLEYLEDGVLRGLSAEYLKEISQRTGLTFTFKPLRNGQSRVDGVRRGEVDVLSLASRNLGAEARDSNLRFTSAYIISAAVVVACACDPVITDLQQLEGKKVVLPTYGPYTELLQNKLPNLVFTADGQATSLLETVAQGKADATIGSEVYLVPYLNRRYEGVLQIAGVLPTLTSDIAMAVSHDNAILWSILQKALRSISPEDAHRLRHDWIESTDLGAPSVDVLIRHYGWQVLAIAATLGLLGFLAYSTWYEYRRAVRNERERDMFLAVLNHEIRSPMHAVLASIELLLRTPMNEKQRHLAGLANGGASSLLRLLDNVLDISKLEAGELILHHEPTDVAELAREVVELHRLQADQKGIGLVMTMAQPYPRLMLDAARVSQILHNLVSNAIKFTDNGQVDVELAFVPDSSAPQTGMLHIRVSDTGVGIDTRTQEKLFQPYVQGNGARKNRVGTGLGLLICHELVTYMQGSIALHSEPGHGTTIKIALPVIIGVTSDSTTHGTDRREQGSCVPLKVLLVEDAPANQYVLKAQLTQLGCVVVVTGNGAAAGLAYQEDRYDLVLMDCDLPDISGYALAEKLRAYEIEAGLPRCPIIAISASSGSEHAKRCIDAGMDAVISKPIRMAKLQDAIEIWCGVG